jgi:hypothetical protein
MSSNSASVLGDRLQFPHPDQINSDGQTRLDRPLTVKHDKSITMPCSVKAYGKYRLPPRTAFEMPTLASQTGSLSLGQLGDEVIGKPRWIAFHRAVALSCFDVI